MDKIFQFKKIISSVSLHMNCFHCSSVCSSLSKEGNAMRKILRGSTTKRKWYNPPTPGVVEHNPTSLTQSKGQNAKGATRRISVLNKLFMRYISDIMATGDITSKIAGRGIEITQVRIAPDFNKLNIFWAAKGVPEDSETEKILEDISYELRHELSQLRVMGTVPRLAFVKDEIYTRSLEVDLLLASADYGEDFQPTDLSHTLKSEFILNSTLEPHIKEKIYTLEKNDEMEDEKQMPPMRNDVFGLNRDIVLNRITQSIQRSNDAWKRSALNLEIHNHQLENTEAENITTSTGIEHKMQFKNFLISRQLLRRKAIKKLQADQDDKENYIECNEISEGNDDYDSYDGIWYEDEEFDAEIENSDLGNKI